MILQLDHEERRHLLDRMDRRHPDRSGAGSFWSAESAGPPRAPPTQSPASQPRPKSATPQTYTAAQIREGEVRFGAQCGFCHGKDAAGGESGPDLTRSELVAQDARGDKVGPMIRAGRPNAGMPSFSTLSEDDLNAIVAFLHSQMDKFAELGEAGVPWIRRIWPPATLPPAASTSTARESVPRATLPPEIWPESASGFKD